MRTVIVDGFRTAFCKEGTLLKDVPADFLGALAVREMLKRMDNWNLPPTAIEYVIGSSVTEPAHAKNIAHVVSVKGGVPDWVPGHTLNHNCGSGITAVDEARNLIEKGVYSCVLVVGVESMSRIPLLYSDVVKEDFYSLQRARTMKEKIAITLRLYSKLFRFWKKEYAPQVGLIMGLTDPICDLIMGLTAEKLAKDPSLGITREDQDRFALRSNKLAAKAQEIGIFKQEIAPLIIPTGKDCFYVDSDNGLRKFSKAEIFARSKPFFDKRYGTVTPANSSQITDGAACILLMSQSKAHTLGLPILGCVGEYNVAGFDPSRMGLSPVGAINKLLKKSGRSISNFSTIEINEAFAAQVLACLKVMSSDVLTKKFFSPYGFDKALVEIDSNRLNPNGGAIALGHPVGVSGMRLIITALKELERRGGESALVSACIGGGQGNAMILERST
ncbi:MAG: hypothetical protein A3B86_01980 [Candidatus Yanofskybacteria bacterium RIFCSPHIGHO2_02_FULL_38_22b]|uniref:Acetyl-CoA acyltransferase n=1 Tax=Candidatus Yanofskybacteria bacterium RIFCSPHIGHO2_02_FULL_38_22b TaxID=1802673 RepID=A0A1F8F1Z9_9BACT|nr:MAG: hypothetical protein A2816_00880 [Candidatus Yanofskybacteria bacterium RIFCSPHIGHO2_01_FULL_39_44]OGN07155.1 MAG: hypothetical protein A3B86_01980 [Candidatus Yanofskybacteria bacterium RIFCSPHIGHO2_02_FULL_38_22b]OGN20005.1 MAG: hypothetical protein A2910_00690 [Candidatus Yanofskybacteria bacterium RIFCSPLOWO2_01_FULL_39_28]